MAHDVLLKLIETDKTGYDAEGIAGYAWEIADAMQAEADKRQKEEDLRKNESHEEFMRCIGGKPANL